MSKQPMDIVLPKLAKRLQGQLQRLQAGQLSDAEFARDFAALLQKQFSWLARRGMSETDAALTIHSAVLVLSRPGLQIEAMERGVPLEIVERQAIRAAAEDIAKHYELDEYTAYNTIADVMVQYCD